MCASFTFTHVDVPRKSQLLTIMDSSQQKESTEAVLGKDSKDIEETKQLESPQKSVAGGVIDADETATYEHAGQEGSGSHSNRTGN